MSTRPSVRLPEAPEPGTQSVRRPAPAAFPDPADDPYQSAMLERFSAPARWFAKAFFHGVAADEPSLDGVRYAAEAGSVVYVMRTRSTLDYLFFNDFLARHRLPLARFANGASSTWFAPIGRLIGRAFSRLRKRKLADPVQSGWLAGLLSDGHSALLFLKEPKLFLDDHTPSERDPFEVVIEAQRARTEPIFLVPQILVWERSPDRSNQGLWDVVLGDQEAPSRLRKTLHFLLSFRYAVVRIGRPVNLREFLGENEGQPTPRIAKKLRWLLLGYLFRERKVVKGPDVRPRRWLFQRILAEPAVRTVMEETAQKEGRSLEVIEARARKILDKTGADLRWSMIMFLKTVIDVITSRIYSGVEFSEADAERIRQAGRNGVVLLLPCHRSHLDYLLLSWLCFYQALMPPHIAAGVNLSFWPLGPMFRQGGAFFIRRSFAGDALYTTLLAHYLRALVAEGYPQEFFIEGGRSRSGKMLPPKVGLLATYVEAMADRLVPDIQMVPVGVTYEKIVEGGSYQQELIGGEKRSENAGDLVKSASVLRKRFGRVYVRTGEPISMKAALAGLDRPYRQLGADEKKAFLKMLGHRVVADIQDATVATPSSLAAMALLTHDRRGLTRADFQHRARWFARWLEGRGARFSDSWQFPEDALDEALVMFAEGRLVEILPEEGGEDIIAIASDPARRMMLDYYKNTILFHFVPAALMLSAVVAEGGEEERLSTIQQRFDFLLLDVFREEFMVHPDLPTAQLIAEAGRGLQRQRVVRTRREGEAADPGEDRALGDGLLRTADLPPTQLWLDKPEAREADVYVRIADSEKAAWLIETVRNFLESYWVVLEGSKVLLKGAMGEKEFVASLLQTARRMVLTEDLTRPESCSKINLSNAVLRFKSRGVLRAVPGEKEGESLLSVDEGARERYLRPLERLFHGGRLGRMR